ncbi:BTAD domain-containing putative transcriptional regulator [Kribbella sp. NPDC050820]|uniref:nSTAND1 domain-containing NTPase n=1 Tax=Kribbella sp. NPDC050820 TaxID=3155408 RepID=UPI0033C38566
MGIAVLGPLTIEGDQKALARRDRVVLAALAVHPGDVVSADQLAHVLWGERLPASWPKVVQGCVVRLRKVLGTHAIETAPPGYRLAVPLDEIDSQRFDRAVVRARGLLAAGEPERSGLVLADALTLWRGRPLTELDGWDPARIEVSRLTELRQAAEELYVESALRSGQHDQVMAKAQALVSEDPLRERRWVLLATAQYQAGRQGEALRTIQRLRGALNRELGLDPSPEIDALEQAILPQDPALTVQSPLPEPSPVCPYPGLRPYDVDDADGFFGRDADIAACLRILTENSVLAVAGPSGCGKSSLVRAGVAAALRRDGQRVVVMTPGPHPVAALAAALPTTGSAPVLLVDQLEEVFTLCHDDAEREAFLAALNSHQAVAPLIMSIRADRLPDVSSNAGFARVVERGLYLLSGLTRPALRSAVEEPARLASLVVEPGLVDLVVNDVADQPGALPLMSHALRETWRRREGRTLTVAGYNASGGIRGAVAQSAEQVHEQASPGERAVLRDLLLRLVAPGPEGEPVRSRMPRRLVISRPEDDTMLDRLVASRLVTSDAGAVELAHESLVRAWPRLRGWLDDDLDGQRILHHLAIAADSWNTVGRADSELYRGVRLAKALDWRERAAPTLTAVEEEFLAASKRLSERELRAAEDQARQERHINRRLRGALAAAALLLVGALIAGLVAVRQADRLEQAAINDLARQASARSLLTDDISLSLLLAVQAARFDDSAETRANLVTVMNKRPLLTRSIPSASGRTETVEVSPDGSRIVSGDSRANFHLYDAESGRVLASHSFGSLPPGEEVFARPQFSPDGSLLAVIAFDPAGVPLAPDWPVRLLKADTLEPVAPQPKLEGFVPLALTALAFSADGRYLAAGMRVEQSSVENSFSPPTGLAMIWDLTAVDRAPRTVVLRDNPMGIELSPDGGTLYTAWPLGAYDVRTRRLKWQHQDTFVVPGFDLSRNGELLAYNEAGDNWWSAALADARTGAVVRVLPTRSDPARGLAFSPDGKLLATTESGGDAVVWDVASGTRRHTIRTAEVPWAVGFGPDSQTLYTGGDDGVLRSYDLAGRHRHVRSTTAVPVRQYADVLASDNGQRTAYLWREGDATWMRVADHAAGTVTPPVQLGLDWPVGRQAPMAWHPNGNQLVVHDGSSLRVVDALKGAVVKTVDDLPDRANVNVRSIAYVDNGRQIAVGGWERVMYFDPALKPNDEELWSTGKTTYVPATCCMASSADGRLMVVFEDLMSGDRQVWRVMDTETGAIVSEGDVPLRLNHATFSPGGDLVAGTGTGGDVVLIDVRSGTVKRAATTEHTDQGLAVRFSPDGSRIVSGAVDGTVSVWDTRTLASLGTVSVAAEGEPHAVSPAFLTDGTVTISSYDGKIHQWDIDPEKTIAYACTMAGRNLTADEWTQAFAGRPYQQTCP